MINNIFFFIINLKIIFSLTCNPGDRSYCSYRGYCTEDNLCKCDDFLHYWPSEQCSTWHDGPELSPGQFCYPNNVDQYCSWMGICNSDGSSCNCFDNEHRYSEERCFIWHPSPSSSPPPTGPPSTPTSSTCTPRDRSYCSNRGYCDLDGSGCVCDDYLHYWPSEKCGIWHNGRELETGLCCYPNTVDQYCSWMGVCSSDGNSCECFDSEHRTYVDRCFNWYPDISSQTFAPTMAPPFTSLNLSPQVHNQSCLFLSLIDNFGDGWGDNIYFLYETLNSTIGGLTLRKGSNGYKIEGCLPKLSSSHPMFLSIASDHNSQYLWEIQWSVEIISPHSAPQKYFGGYDTSFQFYYDSNLDSYTLQYWDGLWVYPEQSDACANLPGSYNCQLFEFHYAPNISSPSLNFTGGNYEEASWVITNSSFLDVLDYGIPWGAAITHNSIDTTCDTCLSDGEYVLRVSGANYPSPNDISWTFCGVSGGAMNQLTFVIQNGICIPSLPIETLKTLVFNDICPPMPAYPTSSPTLYPPTLAPVTAPPSTSPTQVSPPSYVPTSNPTQLSSSPTVAPTLVLSSSPSSSPTLTPLNYPVILNLNVDDTTPSCVLVTAQVTITELGGSVFCASFPSPYSLSNVWMVIQQNHWVAAPQTINFPPNTMFSNVGLQICSLNPFTEYKFYCVATDPWGTPTTTLSEAISNSVSLITTFSISSEITSSASGYALNEMSHYNSLTSDELSLFTVSFELEYAPPNDVYVGLAFFDILTDARRYDVHFSPSSYRITNTAVGSGLKGTFLIFGPTGTYNVRLEFTGPSAHLYMVSNYVEITIISGGINSLPPLMPVISSALFDYSGTRIIVSFSVATDYAITVVDTNIWNCDRVFQFDGAHEASCVWTDAMTVIITLNYYGRASSLVSKGQYITLLDGVLKGASLASPYASSSTLPLSVVKTHVLPSAVLVAPKEVVVCKDLIIDASLSIGQGGRDWKTVLWRVDAADGGDVSVFLNTLLAKTSIDTPIIIPSSALRATTYSISLGLQNFLQDPSDEVIYTSVMVEVHSSGPIVSLSLNTAPILNIEQSSLLVIDADAELSSCSNTLLTSSVTYSWKVKKNNILDNTITSLAPNAATFYVRGNAFDLESVYEIILDVTFSDSTNSWSNSESVIVFGVQSSVKAFISGGISSISISSSDHLTLDAVASVGSSLSYYWSCHIISSDNYGADYFAMINYIPSGHTLNFPGFTFHPGSIYLVTLVVTSTTVSGSVSDSTTLTISVPTSIADVSITYEAPIPSFPFNIQEPLHILASLHSDSSIDVQASWSIINPVSFDLSFPQTSLVPLTRNFDSVQLISGIMYPLGVSPNSLAPGKFVFRLSASQPGVSDRFMDITVQCTSPPIGGDLTISPMNGIEYETVFSLSAPYWASDPDNYPFFYQFIYQIRSVFDWSTSYSLVTARRLSPHASTVFPSGDSSNLVAVAVLVSDIWGAEAKVSGSLHVLPNLRRKLTTATFESYLNSFSIATSTSQLDAMISSYQMAVNLVNDITRSDCSHAPNCIDLNRETCSSTSQTCGNCISGFSGVFGDYNSACHALDDVKFSVGEPCTSNSDCFYDYCNSNNVCDLPLQLCPYGSNGEICSGHGICKGFTLQGDLITDGCTVDNTDCVSTCLCDDGYGGDDCSMTSEQVNSMRQNRASLCTALDILTDSLVFNEDRIMMQVNYLLEISDSSSTSLESCKVSLATLSDLIQTSSLSAQMNSKIAEVISIYSNIPEILSLVSVYQRSVYETMIPGQSSISFATKNYRALWTYERLDDLFGATLSVPSTIIERNYKKSPYNISLPDNGLSVCSNFEDYAKVILTVWGNSPYDIPAGAVKGNLITTTTYSTGSQAASNASDSYSFNLRFADSIDLLSYQPICLEYDIVSSRLSSCANCEVTSFSSHVAQVSCDDASAYFCPSLDTETASFVRHLEQLSESKIYTIGVSPLTVDPFSASDTQDKMSTGVLSFISVYLFAALIGGVLLFWWDQSDRNRFITSSLQESNQKQSSTYILAAAFDESGRKSNIGVRLSQISATYRGTSLSHDRAYSREQRSLFALNNPLNNVSNNVVDRNGRPIPNISVQSTPRTTTLSDSQPSSSIVDLDALSERRSQGASIVEAPTESISEPPISSWSDLPISSLLSEHSWMLRVFHAIGRHHKWVRIFTYPSMRRSRMIRFIVAATDLLFIIFTNSVFYMIFYPDDGSCQTHSNTSSNDCLSQRSKFQPDVSLCRWDDNGSCTLREPPFTLTFIMEVCMIVIVFSSIPRSLFQYLIEKVCAKRPIVEDIGMSASFALPQEPVPVTAGYKVKQQGRILLDVDVSTDSYALTHCDHMTIQEECEVVLNEKPLLDGDSSSHDLNQILTTQRQLLNLDQTGALKQLTWRQWFLFHSSLGHLQWKIRRARNEAATLIRKLINGTEVGPDQTDYADMCILQYFILEQVSPITRFALKKDIFEMDHASPGRIGFLPWIFAWFGVIGVWIFMASWVIAWSVQNGAGPARAWGLVLGIVVIADMITNELSQIYFLHVHMTEKLRPQLRDIYGVLSDILECRLQHKSPRYGGLRVPQHFSPACRASRSQSLSGYLSSHILSLIDDLDIITCRQSRLTHLRDVGLFSWMTLFHPSLLNTTHDLFQQTAMDIIVPIAWCCFILLNHAILQFSVYLLIGLYIGGFLFTLWFYFFVISTPSKPYQDITISGRRKTMKDPSELELVKNVNNVQSLYQNGNAIILGSEMENTTTTTNDYLALPISDGPTKSEDVDLYFSSDIFAGQQMIIQEENEETI